MGGGNLQYVMMIDDDDDDESSYLHADRNWMADGQKAVIKTSACFFNVAT